MVTSFLMIADSYLIDNSLELSLDGLRVNQPSVEVNVYRN